MIDLIKEYQKLEKGEPYVKVPLTSDEWDLIIERLESY